MIGAFWSIDIALAVVSSVVMAVAFSFYVRKMMEYRTKFTVGLAVFSGAFFAQGLVSTAVFYYLAQSYSAEVAIPLMIIMVIELIGALSFLAVVEQ